MPLECYYTFERMQEIVNECKLRTREYVSGKLDKTVDQIDAICKRVEKGPSTEFKMIQVISMLLSKFNKARSMGIVVKDDTIRRWVCEIKFSLNFQKVFCFNSFISISCI